MNSSSSSSRSLSRRGFVRQLSAAAAAALALPRLVRAAPEPASRKLGFVLVGLGGYATGELGPALRQTQHCRLVGVVTGEREKGRRWAHEYGFPEKNIYSYDTMHQMADNPDIDVVYVVTPNALHAEHTIAAANAGKHVICEKPMAISVAECDQMIAACRKAGRKLSIGYRLYFDPYHREMMRLAKDPTFGPFTNMEGSFGFPLTQHVWRATKKLAGGGPIMDVGIYVIQNACMAAGGMPADGGPYIAPTAVVAHEGPKTNPELFRDVEESMRWTFEFPGGAIAHGQTSYAESSNRFHNTAAHGWFEMDPAYTYRGLHSRTSRGPLDFPPTNQQARQMDAFAECVLQDRESPVSGEMGRRDLAIIEAIYASAANGGRRTEIKA